MKAALIAVVVALVAFMGWGAYLSNTKDGEERIAQRKAIKECRDGENDQLQELSVRRTIREVCDKMEADYVAKWGSSP